MCICQNLEVEGKLGPGNFTELQGKSKGESDRPSLVETNAQF